MRKDPSIEVSVNSEIGELEALIMHTPGPEVENMTPKNAERALYSDILNLSVASGEYSRLSGVLSAITNTLFVEDLLSDIVKDENLKNDLVFRICANECSERISGDLMGLDPRSLSKILIQGVPLKRNNLTRFLSEDNFSLKPLHNFFFTRDSSVAIYDHILIPKMANKVREREALIMETIFSHHPLFKTWIYNPFHTEKGFPDLHMEGGDILVARKDIILMGVGSRTSSQGVDYMIDRMKEKKDKRHIIIQELPSKPESFIHLDMTFTLLDRDHCMVYEPLILTPNRYTTVHIEIDNGNVRLNTVKNIPDRLRELGLDLKISYCGGKGDPITQEREQWHSGANFFAFAPGKVIGYSRNVHTLDDLDKNGFSIIQSQDIIDGKVHPDDYQRCVVVFDGSELARGGGGARCMTMPVKRKDPGI